MGELCVCCRRRRKHLQKSEDGLAERPGGGLTHGALPHQADEVMRPRLPRHPQQDLPDRAVGEPAVLTTVSQVSVCGRMEV